MGWGDETRNLTLDIAASHEVRKEAVEQLREDTRDTLAQFDAELKQMSTKLKADLSHIKPDLTKADAERVRQHQTDLRQRQSELKDMFAQINTTLAKVKPEMSQAEAERVRQTQAELKDIFAQVNDTLAKVKPELGQAEVERVRQTQAELKDIFTQVKDTLAKIKPGLAQYEAERVEQTKVDLKQRHAEVKYRIDQVSRLLSENKDEREKSAAAWQELAGVIQAKKEAPAAVAEPAPAKAPTEEWAEEETMAEAKPVEMTPETAALSDRVFDYLADHPDGTRMTELESEFVTARIQMANILKGLMDDNKVEKREKHYFAI